MKKTSDAEKGSVRSLLDRSGNEFPCPCFISALVVVTVVAMTRASKNK